MSIADLYYILLKHHWNYVFKIQNSITRLSSTYALKYLPFKEDAFCLLVIYINSNFFYHSFGVQPTKKMPPPNHHITFNSHITSYTLRRLIHVEQQGKIEKKRVYTLLQFYRLHFIINSNTIKFIITTNFMP